MFTVLLRTHKNYLWYFQVTSMSSTMAFVATFMRAMSKFSRTITTITLYAPHSPKAVPLLTPTTQPTTWGEAVSVIKLKQG